MKQLGGFTCAVMLGIALCAQVGAAPAPDAARADRIRASWVDRPWDFRYLLIVSLQGEEGVNGIRKRWSERVQKGHMLTFAGLAALTDAGARLPASTQSIAAGKAPSPDSIQVFVMRFDSSGKVLNARAPLPQTSRGRMTQTFALYLQEDDTPNSRLHFLGNWFQGFPDAELWAPSVCIDADMPTPVAEARVDYRYDSKFAKNRGLIGNFGCREWAFQLKDNDRAYIDITSYELSTPGNPSGTYVREFIGFARFQDKPKPVIGAHQGRWFCLHECPGGEPPSEIKDINAWAAKQGWAPPQRPKRQPMFPDSLYSDSKGQTVD